MYDDAKQPARANDLSAFLVSIMSFYSVLTAPRYARVCVSSSVPRVCLSVRPSVTRCHIDSKLITIGSCGFTDR